MRYCFGMSVVFMALAVFHNLADTDEVAISAIFLVGFLILAEMRKGARNGS